jgi:membrane-associated phospholipid phosphatase
MRAEDNPPPADRPREPLGRLRDGLGRYTHSHPTRINALFFAGLAMFLAVGYLGPRARLNPDDLNTPRYPAAGATALALAAAAAVDLLLLAAFFAHDRAIRRGTYSNRDPGALVPPALRPFCWLVIVPALAGVAILASRVTNSRGPLAIDRRVDDPVVYRLHPLRPLFADLTQLGSPPGVAALSVLLGVACLSVRRWRAALLALACPPLGGALTEYALKPLVGRRAGHYFAFPSGHTTGAVAVAAVITLLLLPAGAFTRLPHWLRLLLALTAVVLASAVPLGLIVLRYHYATDVLAGAAVALAVTVTLALALDATARQLSSTTHSIRGTDKLPTVRSESHQG